MGQPKSTEVFIHHRSEKYKLDAAGIIFDLLHITNACMQISSLIFFLHWTKNDREIWSFVIHPHHSYASTPFKLLLNSCWCFSSVILHTDTGTNWLFLYVVFLSHFIVCLVPSSKKGRKKKNITIYLDGVICPKRHARLEDNKNAAFLWCYRQRWIKSKFTGPL